MSNSMQVVLRRAQSGEFFDILMPSLTTLVYRENGMTLEKILRNGLPEEVENVPETLTAGKIISVDGIVYVGNTNNVPVKITYTHPTGSGNNHIPAGGAINQYLKYDADGVAVWSPLPAASESESGITKLSDAIDSSDSTVAASSAAVKAAYDKANHAHPYVTKDSIGSAGGVAPLDEGGLISSQYLPSYVDDVLDGTINEALTEFTLVGEDTPCEPETGKIYLDVNTNKQYRWSGSLYACMNDSVALGETENTAYRGDRGKVAYEHSQSAHAPADATKTEASSTNGKIKIAGAEVTVYTHPNTDGNKHLPSGGVANQYLKNISSGTGEWATADTTPTEDSNNLITSGAVFTAKTELIASIGTKADANHNHNDLYYPRDEVDTALSGKANNTHRHNNASFAEDGFMASKDFVKLSGIEDGANATVVDTALSDTSENPVQNKIVKTALDSKSDATHVHATATDQLDGFMPSSAVKKLADIEDGANKIIVDTELDEYSSNPVENSVVTEALSGKSDATHTHDLASASSNGMMSSSDYAKLAGIETGANKTVIDETLNETSNNPIQNRIVYAALSEKADVVDLDTKQDAITGAASTIVSDNLLESHALISNASGKVAASPITSTELAYLDGVTGNIQQQINAKASIESPAFTGVPTAPTATAGTNTTQLATTAFVLAQVNALLEAKDALRFIGTLDPGDTLPAANAGHVYRATGDGTISTLEVHTGDTLTCCVDNTPENTFQNWYVTHVNHDGQVMGPASAVDSHVAVYDGITGTLIKDSGFTIGTSVPADAVFTDTVYTHPNSGVDANSYGPTADTTVTFGDALSIPQITVDEKGHVTVASTKSITLPDAPTSVSGNAGTATKLATARNISIVGDIKGSASFDGSTDITIQAELVSAGLNVQYSSTQPTDQIAGDQWYEPIEAINA